MQNRTKLWLSVLLLSAACEAGGAPGRPSGNAFPTGSGPDPFASSGGQPGAQSSQVAAPYKVSQGSSVLWKRHAAIEADLVRALELKPEELCKELGVRDCIRDIHVIALGGNDPFRSGINVPASRPLSTTSVVVDRVLLSACGARARADRAAKPGRVFTELDLAGPAPKADAPGVEATIKTLFRKLLGRDPLPGETAIVKTLLEGDEASLPQSAEEFATLACFTIGSSLEFLFL
jgi:hypothetical protein